jgi:hypothetical protein
MNFKIMSDKRRIELLAQFLKHPEVFTFWVQDGKVWFE